MSANTYSSEIRTIRGAEILILTHKCDDYQAKVFSSSLARVPLKSQIQDGNLLGAGVVRVNEKLKMQIGEDIEELIVCSNELWRLRSEFDFAIDNLEQTLREVKILEDVKP
jgi:hypothetical protein